jgi:DHA2 family multidrug resistance protein
VSSTMLNDRLNFHYERLDEHLNTGRPVVESLLQKQADYFAAIGGDVLNAANAGLNQLHALLMREALVLTFSDAFFALSLCFVVGLLSVLFSRPFGNSAPPPDAH